MEDKAKNRMKILIVEDSPTQALELQYMLGKNNYSALIAKNGKEALKLINQYKPAIVISDIVMPEMDGYQLCEHIKKNERLKGISVMLLTSLSEPQDVIKSLQCGADKFFTKPYDENFLLSTIQNLLFDHYSPDVEESEKSIEFYYKDKQYTIDSNRMQIINLLISIYEAAVLKNNLLIKTQDELKMLNKSLEEKIMERTSDLQIKNEELKIISQQLWQASKLATMGELSASIAHELNNPLATVNLRLESLLALIPPEDSKRRALEVIEQEVDRMANLVANLLQFSRRSQSEISTVDVCKEIDGTLELIYYHLRKHGISVRQEIAADIPYIHADRQQLRQLFLNLFTNSSDAMPEGGTLTIKVYNRGSGVRGQGSGDRGQGSEVEGQGPASRAQGSGVRGSPDPRIPIPDPRSLSGPEAEPRSPIPDPNSSAFVVVEITDTGVGISPDVLPKVMEPFFTTKPEGKGTGLGLLICRRIVQEHKGTFDITSEGVPGRGTAVRISFPVKNGMNAEIL